MRESYAFDAAIVGAGIAGLVSAVRLAEQGLRVGVLEKGEHEKYPCNSRIPGGERNRGRAQKLIKNDQVISFDLMQRHRHTRIEAARNQGRIEGDSHVS